MTFAGFNVPPEGRQGFGRRLPFGSSVLLDVTQAGSFSNRIVKSADRLHKGGGEVQRSPRIKGSPLTAARGGCGVRVRLSPQGKDTGRTLGIASGRGQQEKRLEPSPEHRG